MATKHSKKTALTQTDFGAAVGITQQAVSALEHQGVLDLSRGMDQSIKDYCGHLIEQVALRYMFPDRGRM